MEVEVWRHGQKPPATEDMRKTGMNRKGTEASEKGQPRPLPDAH